jgi:hypothetical protein
MPGTWKHDWARLGTAAWTPVRHLLVLLGMSNRKTLDQSEGQIAEIGLEIEACALTMFVYRSEPGQLSDICLRLGSVSRSTTWIYSGNNRVV